MSRCIFCKCDSSSSSSVEHILPESIGNKNDVLPQGIVCDKCNNYFSRKIEKQVLNSGVIKTVRSRLQIESKKGRIPPIPSNESKKLPDYQTMARFLGKVGLEALAKRLRTIDGWENSVIDEEEFDPLRDFVRFNRSTEDWVFTFRTLHPANAVFFDGKEHYQIFHEYDLLYTTTHELFIIVSIFGVEFALNLCDTDVTGYLDWVSANNGDSFLYSKDGVNIEKYPE